MKINWLIKHGQIHLQKSSLSKVLAVGFVPVVIFLIAFGAVSWRSSLAPDVFTDEIIYTRLGTRVAAEGALVWDSGKPFLVHPPLYFLVEGVYLFLTGNPPDQYLNPQGVFTDVYHARLLNAILAGFAAVVLYAVGRRLRGFWPGLLMVAVIVVDPFGVRINRRAMLETLAELITFAGMGLFAINLMKDRPKYSWSLWAGLLLGAGLLTKELTLTSLFGVCLFGIWEFVRSVQKASQYKANRFLMPVQALLTLATALLTYAIYPLWIIRDGHWSAFWSEKILELQRLVGLVQLTGWNRPGVSLSQFLLACLADYGSSYFLLALGGAAVIWILVNHWHTLQGRFVAAWGLVLYPFFAFTALAGSGNDQFFYYLLVPATFLVGYALSLPPVFPVFYQLQQGLRSGLVTFILLFIIPYNGYQWIRTFGTGQDNAYFQLAQYIRSSLPAESAINASGDPIKFQYFLPDYPITTVTTQAQALREGVHYYALAPKDVQAHYGKITPLMATWIETNGTMLARFSGNSYGDVYLYRIDFPDGKNANLAGLSASGSGYSNVIHPPESNFVTPLVVFLVFWLLLVGEMCPYFINIYIDSEPWQPMKEVERTRETRSV